MNSYNAEGFAAIITPANLLVVFVIPFLVAGIINRLTKYAAVKFNLAEEGVAAPEAVLQEGAPMMNFQWAMPILDVLAKYIRYLFIIIFSGYVLLFSLMLIGHNKSGWDFLVSLIYLLFFIIALAFHLSRVSRKVRGVLDEKNWARIEFVYTYIMFGHIFWLLYLMMFGHYYNQLVHSSRQATLNALINLFVLSWLPAMCILLLRDMVQRKIQGITTVVVFLLSCCLLTYLYMFAGYCYKVF